MKNPVLNLNWFEIITLVIALVSIAFSYYQWTENKRIQNELRAPIYNSLVGLFMDIKTKKNNAVLQQQFVATSNNPHDSLDTLKWEYQQFALNVSSDMQGFQETVTGLLITLNPKDKVGKDVFRASEFGQTEVERRLLEEFYKNRTPAQLENDKESQQEPIY